MLAHGVSVFLFLNVSFRWSHSNETHSMMLLRNERVFVAFGVARQKPLASLPHVDSMRLQDLSPQV